MKKKKFWEEVKEDLIIPVILLACILILTIISSIFFNKVPTIIHLGIYKDSNFWEGFLTNLHNSVLDVLLFGIFFTVIAKRIEWKRQIQKYEDTIRENSELNGDNIPHKISQCIRRLNEYGIYEINLTKSNLIGANLGVINNRVVRLENSMLMGANLSNANLQKIILNGSNLKGANLKNSKLNSASLVSSELRNIKCYNTDCTGAIFKGADLLRADLKNSFFKNADFREADLKEVNYENSSFEDANFIGAVNLDIEALKKAKSLRKIKIEQPLMIQLKNECPELFAK